MLPRCRSSPSLICCRPRAAAGRERHHAERGVIVFDDSKLHNAFNDTDEERVVLIVDIMRPPGVPKGRAKGGHTKELDGLIDLFS